jgi:acetyltransferase-like isoleucine patch superfamily enzyme
MALFVSPLAVIDNHVNLCEGVSVWHFTHIRSNAFIGENSIIGKSVYIGPGVRLGRNCKVQNNSQIFEPAEISDFVFIGPGVILTNDRYPRATSPDGTMKTADDWEKVGVKIEEGASVGANCTLVAPVTIGKWAMIGSGSVVTKDVKAYALVMGTPAKQLGWVSKFGQQLINLGKNNFYCANTSTFFSVQDGKLVAIEK